MMNPFSGRGSDIFSLLSLFDNVGKRSDNPMDAFGGTFGGMPPQNVFGNLLSPFGFGGGNQMMPMSTPHGFSPLFSLINMMFGNSGFNQPGFGTPKKASTMNPRIRGL